jgi:hypothetical protein
MSKTRLIDVIDNANFDPELFGGFIVQDINFVKYFDFDEDTIDKVFERINVFLLENGYKILDFANNWGEDGITNELMSAYGNPIIFDNIGPNIVLVIYRKIKFQQ